MPLGILHSFIFTENVKPEAWLEKACERRWGTPALESQCEAYRSDGVGVRM